MKKYLRMFCWDKYFSKKEQRNLLILLLIGMGLRIYLAANAQFWRDEVYIFFTSKDNSFWDLLVQNHWDTAHPPLYFLFLHYWQMLGIKPFFLRIPSLFLSLSILYLVPIVSKKMLPKLKSFSFFVLLLYSFSKSQISLTAVARPYPFAIFFMMLSMILFFELLKMKQRDNFILWLFGSVNFLGFFSDYSFVWLMLGYVAYFVFGLVLKYFSKVQVKNILLGGGISLMLCMLWVPGLLKGLTNSFELESHLDPLFESSNPFQTNIWQSDFFLGITVNDYLSGAWFLEMWNWRLVLSLLAIFGQALGIKNHNKFGWFIFSIGIAPLVSSFLFSLLVEPIFLGRNLLVVNIAVILAMAYLISVFNTKYRNKFALVGIISLLIISYVPDAGEIQYVDSAYDWEGLSKLISEDVRIKKYLISSSGYYFFDPVLYYGQFYKLGDLEVLGNSNKEIKINEDDRLYLIDLFDHNIGGYLSRFMVENKLECIEVDGFENMSISKCE